MLNNEMEFVLSDMSTYLEFDKENFVANAQSSLTNNNNIVHAHVDLSSFTVMISKTISDLDQMQIDKNSMIPFFASCSKGVCETMREEVPGINSSDVLTIKPNYLIDFVTNIGLIIDRTLKGADTRADLDRLLSSDMVERVKKQMVKTTLPYIYDARKLATIDNSKKVRVSPEYFQDTVIPFLKSSDTSLNLLRNEATNCLSVINKCYKEVEAYESTLDSISKNNEISGDTVKKLNYVTYNAFRALLDVTSFLSFMMIRKINNYTSNIQACTNIYTKLSSVGNMIESTFDTQSVIPADTHSLCEDLIQGRTGAFDELAINIYDFNTGVLMNSPESPMITLGKDASIGVENVIDDTEYSTKQYDEANKMYTIINKGLDIISQYSDDYLMVFDDIISKAGFGVGLPDRFRSVIETLDDISEYTSATNLSIYSELIYLKMLHEVKEYPDNMSRLASIISDCKTRVDMLTKRFNDNIQGEYANAQAINELKIFMEGFTEQLTTLTNLVGAKFMLRLKNIGLAIEQMNILRDRKMNDVPDAPVAERVTFNEGLCEDVIINYESYIDEVFEEMSKQFIAARTFKNKGAILLFEDGEDNNGGNNTNNNQANTTTQTTTTQTQTTNNNNNGGKKTKSSFIDFLRQWFDKLSQKLNGLIEDKRAKVDQKYIDDHRQEFLSKDYSQLVANNVKVEEKVVPYTKMQEDLNTISSRINTATFEKLKSENEPIEILNQVFAGIADKSLWEGPGVADTVTAFYRGEYINGRKVEINIAESRGEDLKKRVEWALNYCDGFYTKKIVDMRNTVETIKKNMESVINTLVTESVCDVDFMSFILEADDNNNQNNNQNNQKTTATTTDNNGNANENNDNKNKNITNMNKKINLINRNITFFCSGIMTAAFDRYNNYMLLLRAVISENGNTTNNNNQNS